MSRIPLDDKEEKALESYRMITLHFTDGSQNVGLELDDAFDKESEVTDTLTTVSSRLYFMENLMDLYVMEVIDKQQFVKLRKLFRNKLDDPNRKLAITTVEELHKKYIR